MSRAVPVLLALLCAVQAQARTETLRWEHPDAERPAGFRVHVGYVSRGYVLELDAGDPGENANGRWRYDLPVADNATVYIAVSAYDEFGQRSRLSNEIVRAPGTAPPRPPPDPPPPPDPRDPGLDPTFGERERVTSESNRGVGSGSKWALVGAGDFNGDGNADVLWRNDKRPQELDLWFVDGTEVVGGGPLDGLGDAWEIAQLADFDRDGRTDILWRHRASPNNFALWSMRGRHVDSSVPLVGPGSIFHLVGAADFDGDRRADLLWRKSDDPTNFRIWRMRGGTKLSSAGFTGRRDVVLDTADFDGDGQADILWNQRRKSKKKNRLRLWHMDWDRQAGDEVQIGEKPFQWRLETCGDFDGDGGNDLLWALKKSSSWARKVWLVDDDGISSRDTIAKLSKKWRAAGAHDFDGDGYDDILWYDAKARRIAIWLAGPAPQ